MPDMFSSQSFAEIQKDELIGKVREMYEKGYGLSMISGNAKDVYELIYSFEKDYKMVNLRVTLQSSEEEIESVSQFYPYAYLYENEVKELFGLKINNMNLDFKGNLFKKSMEHPFAPGTKKQNTEGA